MLIPAKRQGQNHAVFISGIVLLALVGVLSALYVFMQVNETRRSHILDRVGTIAAILPAADVRALAGSSADLGNPAYVELKSLLTRIRAANHDARFIYLMGRNDAGTLFFYADSEDPASTDYSPPGQEYPEATPDMQDLLSDGVPRTEGPDRDRWGLWMSGYAPVLDGNGNVIALLGMDVPAYQYLADAIAYSLLPLSAALLLIVILVASERARRREHLAIDQKAEFLSIASHEIRTPLTGIRWAIEDILKGPTLAPNTPVRSTLGLVHDNCLELIARVNNLLDLSAIENRGRVALKKESIPIRPFVEDIRNSLLLSAKQRGVRLVLDATVPEDENFVADRQTMHHAFFNLLTNAIKYTKENTTVNISYEREAGMHRFRVRDEGDGISAEDRAHIFDGYYRSKEAIRSGQYGTGLGLYLVKRTAELHGGIVEVESVPEKGTTFTLSIPS